MRIFVYGGREGAKKAAASGRVAIIVDALRASATTASLLQFGAQQIIVMEDVDDAFAERARYFGSWLAGERKGLPLPGFDLGNSPLSQPITHIPSTIIFSSSNMSRCCVAAAECPAVFLGSLPNLSACAQAAGTAAYRLQTDIQLIPAGAADDEYKLVLEDYIAAGAIIDSLCHLYADAVPDGDAAHAALAINVAAQQTGYEQAFLHTDNGRYLSQALRLGQDVCTAARVDIYTAVPVISRIYELPSGRRAAILRAASSA